MASPKSDQESWAVELSLTWRQVEPQGLNIAVATACILHQICSANDKQSQYHPRSAPFVGLEIPDIGVVDYCKRLRKYFNCSPSCFVTALMYIDTILTKTKKLSPEHRVVLDTLTIHRLTLVSLVLAVKYHEDNHYSQAYYAQVGGVALSELNAIERKFVEILEWDLDCDCERFSKYYGELVSHPSVCKECQLDTAPVEQKAERPQTPKKAASPKASSSSTTHLSNNNASSSSAAVAVAVAAKPPVPSRKSSVKSTLGKWTSSISHFAANKTIFSELRAQADEDRSNKKKIHLRHEDTTAAVEKENRSPAVEPMETNDASEPFSELSLDETATGPDTNSSPHWHDSISMASRDVLVAAM